MELPKLYLDVRSNKEALKILARTFDVELVTPSQNLADHQVQCTTELTIVAKDGAGGFFALVGTADVESRPVVFVSSEGQAGKIANSFREAMALIVSCPYWYDLLKFSGGAKIDEMRKALTYLEMELKEDEPSFNKKQTIILDILGINKIENPIAELHKAVESGLKEKIISIDGNNLDPLFGNSVADDNPMWRKGAN